MEQITCTTSPHKYIIDASSIFSQKPDEPHRRHIYKRKWKNIDEFILQAIIVTCSEIEAEIKDKELIEWLRQQRCVILPITDEIQHNVRKIVTEHPDLIDFSKCKSSGDAFLIATAMAHNLTVISEENPNSPKKIPQVCRAYGVNCVNITELCEAEHWEF